MSTSIVRIPSKKRLGKWHAVSVVLLLFAAAEPAVGSDLTRFNKTIALVSGHYRAAISYLHTGNVDLALVELDDLTEGWKEVEAQFGEAAPDAFSDDPAWKETLANVGQRISEGLAAAEGDNLGGAERHLTEIRGILSDLRRRNDVRVFADEIDQVSEAMNILWKFRTDPPDFDSPTQIRTMLDASAVLSFLVDRCRRLAPAETAVDPNFARIVESTLEAAGRLQQAVDQRNERLLVNTLRELRAYEQVLWLKYG